jgi:hypothetical protein
MAAKAADLTVFDATGENPRDGGTDVDGDGPNKRPRIDDGDETTESHSSSRDGDAMIIDIADTPSVQIKRDPAALAAPANGDGDSDVEIISPSRLKTKRQQPTSSSLGGHDDDEIQITASTLTAPNIVYPHHRSSCGVHPFSTNSSSNSCIHSSDYNNDKFCPNCFCLVCDVPASRCSEWSNNTNDPSVGPHCHAHHGDAKWINLIKTKRDVAAAATAAATTTVNRPQPRNPYQRSHQQNQPQQNQLPSLNHQQIEQLTPSATDETNANSNNINNRDAQQLRVKSRKEMRIPEVLAENFQKALKIYEDNRRSSRNGNDVASCRTNNNNNVAAATVMDLTTSPAAAAKSATANNQS